MDGDVHTMRWLILIALSVACWAQQDIMGTPNACTKNAQTCAFPKNVTSGNTLVCAADTVGTLTGISDTVSTSWTSIENFSGGGMIGRLWVGAAGGSGADTVTVTGTNSSNGINCIELPSSQWTTTVDAHNSGSYTGTPATVTSNSLTAASNGDFFYYYVGGFQNTGMLQPVAPLLTLGSANGSDSRTLGYKITGVNGSYSGVMNNTTNNQGLHVELLLAPVSGVTITTASLPTASTSAAYSYPLQAIGGVGAYTWSISSGSLPSGLSINSSTGVISGTATGGTQTFTVRAAGATSGTGTKSLTLTVNSSQNSAAFVQNSNGSGSTSASVTATSGNINVVATLTLSGNFNVAVPTDSLGTTYHFCGAIQVPGGGNHVEGITLYMGKLPSTGSNVVTASGSTAFGINVDEFSNAQDSCDTTVFTSGKSAASATLTSNSITTTVPNSMLHLQVDGWTSGTTFTKDAAFTSDGSTRNGTAEPMLGEHKVETSASAYTPTFTQASNTSGEWAMFAMQLMPSTAGAVASNIQRHRGMVF